MEALFTDWRFVVFIITVVLAIGEARYKLIRINKATENGTFKKLNERLSDMDKGLALVCQKVEGMEKTLDRRIEMTDTAFKEQRETTKRIWENIERIRIKAGRVETELRVLSGKKEDRS